MLQRRGDLDLLQAGRLQAVVLSLRARVMEGASLATALSEQGETRDLDEGAQNGNQQDVEWHGAGCER